jgi:hypothetical protein
MENELVHPGKPKSRHASHALKKGATAGSPAKQPPAGVRSAPPHHHHDAPPAKDEALAGSKRKADSPLAQPAKKVIKSMYCLHPEPCIGERALTPSRVSQRPGVAEEDRRPGGRDLRPQVLVGGGAGGGEGLAGCVW